MITSIIRKWSSFTYLNITQFLGALNDNIYKLLVVYFLISIQGLENSHTILAVSGAIFVLPFLLFSAPSGTLADRYSKRNIIILTKVFELVIMLGSVLAFAYENIIGAYVVLFLLAVQSAFFGPSKYGILPELVPPDKISSANGLMTSFTFLAIILGTFLASFVLDITGRDFFFASLFCTVIAIVGLITSFCIEYTPPAGSDKPLNPKFLSEILASLKIASQEPSLLAAVIGSAFFLFLGAFVQLNMIPFAVQSLGLTDVQGGYLFLITALGIGTGCMVAGKISGKTVELGLVPIAGIGVMICSYALDAASHHLYAVIPLVGLLGFFGGMFEIPLDSYIQIKSPNKFRGQIVGATNFLSFFGVLLASGLLYLLSEVFGLKAHKGFLVIGTITLFVSVVLSYQFFDYISRFICMILSRLHFRITFSGQKNIPERTVIYVCYHTDWNDTLLMLGAQRRRMRFFIEHEQNHTKWLKRLYHLLRIVRVPSIEPLENSQICLTVIKNTLKKGISVCIFVENPDIKHEVEKLKDSYSFCDVLEETGAPMIPVIIEKGIKDKHSRFFTRLMAKIHVPASISFGEPINGPTCPLEFHTEHGKICDSSHDNNSNSEKICCPEV
jgi:acyl-[acyl-carrier-protein]-phospholipid O-acyltransferase/long-chain-fatty-acid--[acyl-carrier-protein] ligase